MTETTGDPMHGAAAGHEGPGHVVPLRLLFGVLGLLLVLTVATVGVTGLSSALALMLRLLAGRSPGGTTHIWLRSKVVGPSLQAARVMAQIITSNLRMFIDPSPASYRVCEIGINYTCGPSSCNAKTVCLVTVFRKICYGGVPQDWLCT